MRKVLLATLAVSIVASLAPAHATVLTVTRTIVSPTTFGGTDGVIDLPDIIQNATNPAKWKKMNVRTNTARCGYLLGGTNGQDLSTGKFGFVYKLPALFGKGDYFELKANAANANFDFDVYMAKTIGACYPDSTTPDVACQGLGIPYGAPAPVGGDGPTPDPYERQTTTSSCGSSVVNPRSVYTLIGNEPKQLVGGIGAPYDADYAIVVMPAGANGKFDLILTY